MAAINVGDWLHGLSGPMGDLTEGCVRPTCKKAGRHAGMAVRDAKTLRPMFAVGCPRCKTLRPMFAVGCPRCKNFTVDVCRWLSEMQKTLRPMFAAGCPRCKKTLRPMFAVGCPRCKKTLRRCLRLAVRDAKNSVADVCCCVADVCSWTLRPMFAVGCPRCKNSELCCRCSRLAARDAKNSVADVCGRLPEMQRRLWPLFAIGCLKCEKFGGR